MAAARTVLATRGELDISIHRITELADVGFGSFYNHFTSKEELLQAAIADALDELGRTLEQRTAAITDPAEAFAAKVRLTARAIDTHPQIARIIVRTSPFHLNSGHGLAPHARADIHRAIAAGHFQTTDPELAVSSVAGALLGLLQLQLHSNSAPADGRPEKLTEQLLRGFGMNQHTARTLAHRQLPSMPPHPKRSSTPPAAAAVAPANTTLTRIHH